MFAHAAPDKVVFLDFDDTIASPARNVNGSYIIEADGNINAVLLDKQKLAHLVQTAITNDVPLYIITARADIPSSAKLINDLINSVHGFSNTIGGFHHDAIYFVGAMVNVNGKLVHKEIDTKLNVIQRIHQQKFDYLPRQDLIFVDDTQRNCELVQQAGYTVILANPKTLNHFAQLEKLISEKTAVPQIQHTAPQHISP